MAVPGGASTYSKAIAGQPAARPGIQPRAGTYRAARQSQSRTGNGPPKRGLTPRGRLPAGSATSAGCPDLPGSPPGIGIGKPYADEVRVQPTR
jgi:hypothetical protein